MSAMGQEKAPAAESGVPQELWQRVHFLTPFIHSWHVIVFVPAIILLNNPDLQAVFTNPSMRRYLSTADALLYIVPGLLAFVAIVIGFAYLQWRRTSYALTQEAVWFRHGLLMRSQRHARFDRIQAVDISQPLLGRLFGLGKLRVEVAGGSDSYVEVAFLKIEELESLRERVSTLAAGAHARPAGTVLPSPEAPVAASFPAPEVGQTDALQGVPAQGLPVQTVPGDEALMPAALGAPAPGVVAPAAPKPIPLEERPLYSVPFGRQIHSLVRSMTMLILLLLLVASIVLFFVLLSVEPEAALAMLPVALPLALSIVQVAWKEIGGNFAFSAFATPEGIRIRRGLTETRSQTIPPRRIHAVEVSQPLLWRSKGWYRVRVLQAGYGKFAGADNMNSDLLLSVGTRLDAELAMWLVIPDLGVDNPLTFLKEAFNGSNTTPGRYFTGVPSRVKVIDWFSWKRRAFALTNTALVVREGRFRRRTMIMPTERLQSLTAHQGPLQRRLGVSTVRIDMVPGSVSTAARHIESAVSQALVPQLLRMAATRRSIEYGQYWAERISGDLVPFRDAEAPQASAANASHLPVAPAHMEGTL